MKPLKGDFIITECMGKTYGWTINIPGRAYITHNNDATSEKLARQAAKRFAARCNIEIEEVKA